MFEEAEVLSLILGCVSLGVIAASIGFPKSKALRWFILGVVAILGSYACTNLESVFAAELMNVSEHFLFAVAAICFVIAAVELRKNPAQLADE
jgi:hypothetical protein